MRNKSFTRSDTERSRATRRRHSLDRLTVGDTVRIIGTSRSGRDMVLYGAYDGRSGQGSSETARLITVEGYRSINLYNITAIERIGS